MMYMKRIGRITVLLLISGMLALVPSIAWRLSVTAIIGPPPMITLETGEIIGQTTFWGLLWGFTQASVSDFGFWSGARAIVFTVILLLFAMAVAHPTNRWKSDWVTFTLIALLAAVFFDTVAWGEWSSFQISTIASQAAYAAALMVSALAANRCLLPQHSRR